MDIPKINKTNGIKFNTPENKTPQEQIVEVNYSDEAPQIKQNTEVQQDTTINTQGQTQNNSVVQENKPIQKLQTQQQKEEEYQINDFIENFYKIYTKTVSPILHNYESDRKRTLAITLILCGIIIAGGYYFCNQLYQSTNEFQTMTAILIVVPLVCFWLYHFMKKSFENKLKKRIMPLLMAAFKGFKWTNQQCIDNKEIASTFMIRDADDCHTDIDDNFIGEYKKVPLKIMECKFYKYEYRYGLFECEPAYEFERFLPYKYRNGHHRTVILFDGVVIKIKMNKNIEGNTVILPKKSIFIQDRKHYQLLKNCDLRKVDLEDVEFNKKFEVYSTDQIESRYLITTSFMERLKNISLAFNTKKIRCAFDFDSIYIAPETNKDLFSLANLFKPLDEVKQYKQLLNQFVSILELVDHFKLNQKIGL